MNDFEKQVRAEAELAKKIIDESLKEMFGHDKPRKYFVQGDRVRPIRETSDGVVVDFPADARQGEPPRLIPTGTGTFQLVGFDDENLLYRRVKRGRVPKSEIEFLP